MVDFKLPPVPPNPEGWGPPPGEAINLDYAIESLEKYQNGTIPRMGRICDFTASGQRYQEQRNKGKSKGKGLVATAVPGKDDEGFALVDNKPFPSKTQGRGRGFSFGRARGRGKGIAANYQEGILGQKQKYLPANQTQSKGKGKGSRGGGQQRKGIPSFKDWSVQTKTEWNVMREIMLGALAKLQLNAKEVQYEDLIWCGNMPIYNKDYDRISAKRPEQLKRFEELNFFNISTSYDPHLPELMQADPSVTVIATDHILACLIAAGRSVYSWDIVISKVDNRLIFDKRDSSAMEFLTVNETAQEPPNNDDKDAMNSPVKLGQEASCINQNFSQMVLDVNAQPDQYEMPNPFEEEDEHSVASGAYRYRKIILPGNPKDENEFNQKAVSMIVRTEVNCRMPGGDSQLVSAKALNEFDPKNQPYSWRTHLETQRGAVLANELKNNAFKLGRWTAQAILSGCEVMKLGYASRSHPSDPWSHVILGVQTHFTDQFAEQIGMTRNNAFGILRNIIDLVMTWEDGKYLLLKDPTKSVMRFYEVPWEAFGDEEGEGDEDEEEDDGEELDEDGNVAPQRPV